MPGPQGPAGATGPQGLPLAVQDEGVAFAQRSYLNFVGNGVTATDDGVNDRTTVSISQTPWAGNVNGGGFNLTNTSQIAIGTPGSAGGLTFKLYPGSLNILNNNKSRWNMYATGAESGANSGSDLLIQAGNDAGSLSGTGILINRATGNVGIGTPSPSHLLTVATDSAAKPTTSTWTVTSDVRIKENIRPLEGGLPVINRLRPVESEYNGALGMHKGTRQVSLIAQEVQAVLPHTVGSHRGKLRDTDDEETDILDFNVHEVLFHMMLAIQQLSAQLKELAAK